MRAFPVPAAIFGLSVQRREESGSRKGNRAEEGLKTCSMEIVMLCMLLICDTCYTCSIKNCLMYSEKYIAIL